MRRTLYILSFLCAIMLMVAGCAHKHDRNDPMFPPEIDSSTDATRITGDDDPPPINTWDAEGRGTQIKSPDDTLTIFTPKHNF